MRRRAEQAVIDPTRPVVLANLILLALAVVTIGRCSPAVVAADLPASCPYDFGGDTPVSTFCVYQGVAFDRRGEVCASDVVVVWTSARGPLKMTVQADEAAIPARQIHIAFVDASEVVLQAVVDASQADRADLVGYTIGEDEIPQPLVGSVTLRRRRPGPSRAVDVLEMEVKEPRPFRPGNCALASYSGAFVGVIRSADEAATHAETVIAPAQTCGASIRTR